MLRRLALLFMCSVDLLACAASEADDGSDSSGGLGTANASGGASGSSSGGNDNSGGVSNTSGGSGGASNPTGGAGGNTSGSLTYVYLGSGDWNGTTGKIGAYQINQATGELTLIEDYTAGALNSFAAFHPNKAFFYAGDEGQNRVRAYAIDADTGKLAFLNEQATVGGPVYVNVDASGKFLLTAFYGAGSSQVLGIAADGRLQGSVDTENSGAQSHAIVLDPSNRYAFVPSKGDNKISQYAFDASSGALNANSVASVAQSGGPRHLAFHPSLDYAYGVNEIGNTMTVYGFDANTGRLSTIETENMLPDGFQGSSTAADVHVSPNGKFVYGTNRASGADGSVAIFSIDTATGQITRAGHESSRGQPPRNFAIHPSGGLMLVANHDSSNVSAYSLNPDTGQLTHLRTNSVGVKAYWVGFLVLER